MASVVGESHCRLGRRGLGIENVEAFFIHSSRRGTQSWGLSIRLMRIDDDRCEEASKTEIASACADNVGVSTGPATIIITMLVLFYSRRL